MDIFVININDYKNIDEDLLDKFCHKTFSDKAKQKQHSFSYLMLDRILKEVYGINKYEPIFINKKPYLKNNVKYFSISHSGEYIAICFSDYECGIDIEQIKNRDYKKISKRLNFVSESQEDFYKNWTKYEAEYKLAKQAQSVKQIQIQDYILTAVSERINETFEIYFQISEIFSNP